MKKLLLAVSLLVASAAASAQTVWDFTTIGGMTTTGTTITSIATQGVHDNLGYFVNPTGSAPATAFAIDFSSKSGWAVPTSPAPSVSGPTYTGTVTASTKLLNRLKLGGKGASSTDANPNMPSTNFVYFNVTGNSTIAVFFRCATASPTDGRKLYITDGTNLLNSWTPTSGAAGGDTPYYITASYTGGAGTIYIYGLENAFNLFRIEADKVGTTTEITASSSDAISSALLKQVGDKLLNPTNLDVTITSIGAASFSSSNSEINISALPAGVYVASTKEGSLKFIKQ